MSAARGQFLLDLLIQVPDPCKKRGRRHSLAGLLSVGIAAVIAGARSFAAIGQWAADAGAKTLAVLGATRGAAKESTFRRAFAGVDADRLDAVLGAWLWTRTTQVTGRLVIAIDGKTVRGARTKTTTAPHLVAALAMAPEPCWAKSRSLRNPTRSPQYVTCSKHSPTWPARC